MAEPKLEQSLVLNPRPLSNWSSLDETALVKVFENLDLYDLLQISEIDINYQQIIGEHIIEKRVLDISAVSKHYSTRHAFKQFGAFATKLRVMESDIQWKSDQYTYIEEIFRLINKRCIAGRLKSIAIALDRAKVSRLVNEVPDAFKEIESLTIDMRMEVKKMKNGKEKIKRVGVENDFDGLLEMLLSNCPKLQSLKLFGEHKNWNFLLHPQVHTLQSLSFEDCYIEADKWMEFIEDGVHPTKCLEMIEIEMYHELDLSEYVQKITDAFPDLEKFKFDLDIYTAMNSIVSLVALKKLHSLKEVLYTHYKGQNEFIQTVAKMNTIEKLSSPFYFVSLDDIQNLKNLPKLRTVEILSTYIFKNPWCNEILQLPHLEELSLEAYMLDRKVISKFVESLPVNVRTLKIVNSKITSGFYSSLVKVRRANLPNAPPLQLHAYFEPLKRYSPNVIIAYKID